MRQASLIISTLAFVAIILALSLQQSSVVFGYGYGYGICTGSAPTGLTVEYNHTHSKLLFSWDAVTFAGCAQSEPASYSLHIRKPNSTQVLSYDGIASTTKQVNARLLKSNSSLKYKVRAVGEDASVTEWSLYKAFRTLPGKPKNLQLQRTSSSTIYFSWDNIPQSTHLQYYLVKVRRGNAVVFSKRVHLGFRNARTGVTVPKLKPNKAYAFTVQAVGRPTSMSEIAELRQVIP